MTIDRENIFRGHPEMVSEELKKSPFGAHYLVIYPDLLTFREMYSHYARSILSNIGNEIIIILPYLETPDNVRHILSEDGANINVRKYEKEQSLLIMDSLKIYFGSQDGVKQFIKQTVEYARTTGRSGVSILGDMGSFFYRNKKGDAVRYEMTLPSKYENMNLKGFCMYHRRDFDWRFTEKERQKLIEHHGKTLMLLS